VIEEYGIFDWLGVAFCVTAIVLAVCGAALAPVLIASAISMFFLGIALG